MKTIITNKNILVKLPPISLILLLGQNIRRMSVDDVYKKAEKIGWSKSEIVGMTDEFDKGLMKLGQKEVFRKMRKRHEPYFISPVSSIG